MYFRDDSLDTLPWDSFPRPSFLGIRDKGLNANIGNNETAFLLTVVMKMPRCGCSLWHLFAGPHRLFYLLCQSWSRLVVCFIIARLTRLAALLAVKFSCVVVSNESRQFIYFSLFNCLTVVTLWRGSSYVVAVCWLATRCWPSQLLANQLWAVMLNNVSD